MSLKNINQERYWAYFIGLLLPLAVILAPSYQSNLAEHMFTKSFVLQILIGIGAVVFVFLNRSKAIYLSSHPLAITLYLTFVLGLFSLFWSENQGFTVVQLTKWTSGLFIAFLAFQIKNMLNQRLILQLFFMGALLLAVIGIIQYLFAVDIVKQAAKPASTFANKNMAAQIAVLVWPLGIYLFLSDEAEQKSKNLWMGINSIGTALILCFIFYTQTQAAWLSVIGQVLLLVLVIVVARIKKANLFNFKASHKSFSIAALITLLVFSNISNDGIKPFWEKIQQGADKITIRAANTEGNQATTRYQLWQGAIDMAQSAPAHGVGLGNYYHHAQDFTNARTHTIRSVHNDYLHTLSELGFFSAILMMASWLFLGILFFKSLFLASTNQFKESLSIIAIGGMAITSIFSFPLQLQTPILLISSLISLILTSYNQVSLNKLTKKLLIAISLAISIMVLILNISWNAKLSEFNQKVRANDWKQAIDFDLGRFANHPMLKWFSQRVSTEYMYQKPGSSIQVANSYLHLSSNDAVLLNNKIYSLIKLKRFDEAQKLIKQVRNYEPPGYYRSFYNELILLTELKDFKQLESRLDFLDKEDLGLLSMKRETLDNMSVAAYNLKQFERAINYLKKNIETHPSYINSYKKIIQMFNQVSDKESAAKYTRLLQELEANQK